MAQGEPQRLVLLDFFPSKFHAGVQRYMSVISCKTRTEASRMIVVKFKRCECEMSQHFASCRGGDEIVCIEMQFIVYACNWHA
jgi:hypothetical protein